MLIGYNNSENVAIDIVVFKNAKRLLVPIYSDNFNFDVIERGLFLGGIKYRKIETARGNCLDIVIESLSKYIKLVNILKSHKSGCTFYDEEESIENVRQFFEI